MCLYSNGRYNKAEVSFIEVAERQKKVLGAEHPDTLTSIANLASTYRNQGQWKEAEELEVQVIETSLRVLGEEHPDTLTSMANLASTYKSQGRGHEAARLDSQIEETNKSLERKSNRVWTVAFSPDRMLVALASDSKSVGLWDTTTRIALHMLEGHSSLVLAFVFCPRGK
jgi:WD40 repeat protein